MRLWLSFLMMDFCGVVRGWIIGQSSDLLLRRLVLVDVKVSKNGGELEISHKLTR